MRPVTNIQHLLNLWLAGFTREEALQQFAPSIHNGVSKEWYHVEWTFEYACVIGGFVHRETNSKKVRK